MSIPDTPATCQFSPNQPEVQLVCVAKESSRCLSDSYFGACRCLSRLVVTPFDHPTPCSFHHSRSSRLHPSQLLSLLSQPDLSLASATVATSWPGPVRSGFLLGPALSGNINQAVISLIWYHLAN